MPYEWGAARAIDVFMKLRKDVPGVGVGELGGFVCRVVEIWSSFPRRKGWSRDKVDGFAVVR